MPWTNVDINKNFKTSFPRHMHLYSKSPKSDIPSVNSPHSVRSNE